MNFRSRSSTHTPFSRLVHGFLLLGWLLSYQGIAPVLMLILDGHHMVKACSSQHGEMRVVLGHETETGQHAGGVLQTSCAMDLASSEAGKPDHVFFFQSVEDASRQMRRLALHLPQVASAVSISCFIFKLPVVVQRTHSIRFRQAPAWSPGLEVRSGMAVMRC
jgi:hypothetical protein